MNRNETNVNTGGGSIIGSAVGSGNRLSNVNISIKETLGLDQESSCGDLLTALNEFQSELDKVKDLPSDEMDDIRTNLNASIKAVNQSEPNKQRALDKLKGIQEILDSLKGTAASAIALSKLIGEVLVVTAGIL